MQEPGMEQEHRRGALIWDNTGACVGQEGAGAWEGTMAWEGQE